jgi:RimJ/RimL family protein N-acetyltransferase
MIINNTFQGYRYQLRSVSRNDENEILELRLDPDLNKFLNQTSVDGHRRWLENQISKKGDYYFAIESISTQKSEGFIGIYDITDERAEWGRWILKKNSPAAIESYWLILRFGFEIGCKEIFCRTDMRNGKVLAIHDRLPYSEVLLTEVESIVPTYKIHKLFLEDWPKFEQVIQRYISR